MEAKWPFMLLTFGLLFALGLTIASLEKTTVMSNWNNRRCDLPVAMAAMFFKPESDPRTKSQFAKDNFDFCMKSYIDNFMKILMAPINAVFGKQANLTGSAVDMVNTIRQITGTLYNTLLGFLDTYYRRFNASVYEMSRIVQYLRMAMRRANAMVMSMLYTGITMYRSMINAIQFVIRVILIICGIILAIIIILIFVLFPIIPLILATLGAIVTAVLSLTMAVTGDISGSVSAGGAPSGGLGAQASSDKQAFCFAENTHIIVKNKDGTNRAVCIKDIKIGDNLGYNCGQITAIIKMDGRNINLYDVHGINVSGSHLILGTDNIWKSVSEDERAIITNNTSSILYCFNTTSHKIPVLTSELEDIIFFRDWEELDDDDVEGQELWNHIVLNTLNNGKYYDIWKDSISKYSNIPLIGSNIKIKTQTGFTELSKLNMLDKILDSNNNEQLIIGIIDGEIEDVSHDKNDLWYTELFELKDGIWIKGKSTIGEGKSSLIGKTLITETGEFIIWDEVERKEKIVRDFTDIGYKEIHKTYSMVASRLRIKNSKNQ